MDIIQTIKAITGKTPVYLDDERTSLWLEWYAGDVKAFHHYVVYNGRKKVPCIRRTLNMAKTICEDWANLLMNEKVSIALENEEQTKKLNVLLEKIKFYQKANKGVEESFALGEGAFVWSIDNEAYIKLQFVNRSKIYPLTIEDDEVIECVFVNINSDNVVMQLHLLDENKNYIIRNIKGKKQNNDLNMYVGDLENGNDIIFDTKSNIPWFWFIRPNISNNIDINSPMGISIYANSLSKLEGVDFAYDGLCNELNLAKGRIFADVRTMKYDENGETQVFDNNDIVFYTYGNGDSGTNDPLKFYNPAMRVNDYFEGINRSLNLLSSAVGFGENRYRFDGNGLTTATQVISENSEMYRSIKKHEILLKSMIEGLVKSLIYICNNFANENILFDENSKVIINFDDSIIEDKQSEKVNDRQDVNMGVMSKAEYRAKWYNEDIDTARAKVEDIKQENAVSMSNFFSE